MTTELEPENTPHAVAAADMPRPVLAAAARKLFGRGGVLRPSVDPQTAQAIACGHPSVYQADPDELAPNLPQVVQWSLTALVYHARGVGKPIQANVLEEACVAVAMWRAGGVPADRVEADPTPGLGTVQP